ncbi:MAG: bacillithiol biosynthesis BshC [Planctomycetota bacterium]
MSLPNPRIHRLAPDAGPPTSAFARALRAREGDALEFLPPPPADEAAWRTVLEDVASRARPLPEDVAAAIVERQVALGSGARAVEAARRLVRGEAVAIVTGQQPGLFGGPLLTAHKLAGAVHLARRLDALEGPPVVPVFWCASEDHDLDEANRLGVLDREGVTRLLRVEAAPDGRSLEHVDLAPGALAEVHAALLEALPDTPRAHAAVDPLQPAAAEGFVAHAMRSLLHVFGDAGIVVLDPFDLLPAAGPTLARLVRDGARIHDRIRETGTRLRAAGLPAPLDPEPGSLPLFVRDADDGPRLRVGIEPDGQVSARGDVTAPDLETMAARVEANPRLASGNVVGRVFVQNALLPVVAYIAGPTEIAYQAQVRAAALDLGLPFPLALPRPEATWVDRKTIDRLAAFGLDVGAALARGADAGAPQRATDERWSQAMAEHLATWPASVIDLVQGGGRAGEAMGRALDRLRSTWEKAEASVRAGQAADAGMDGARYARAAEMLWPRGRGQDRFLSPWSFAARHGLEALRAGLGALDPLVPGHVVFELDPAAP